VTPRGFLAGLLRVVKPTPLQALGSIGLALLLLVLLQGQLLLVKMGLGVGSTLSSQVAHWIGAVQTGLEASSVIIFWAAVALAAYLLVWVLSNGVVVSRTQISPETQSVDSAVWVGLLQQLGLKALCGLGLVFYLAYFHLGLNLWLSWSAAVISSVSVVSVLQAVAALLGLAAHLYGILVLAQLTLLPWYIASAPTETSEFPQVSS